jgi:Holliday junction resolvase RusA-like endonuclease
MSLEAINMPDEDPLEERLDQARRGEAPPPFGAMEFTVNGSPASIQSGKPVRDAYVASIRNLFTPIKFLLTGELQLEVRWLLPAKSRFETDAKADIDNCLKPIIDAFTGPEGLFIDDCQLRGLYVCWNHIEFGEERLDFKFEYGPDDFHPKDGIAFVRLEKGLCVPVDLNWPSAVRIVWAAMLKTNEFTKAKLESLGMSYLPLASLLGSSRPFHVTRVQGFKILTLSEFMKGAAEADSKP